MFPDHVRFKITNHALIRWRERIRDSDAKDLLKSIRFAVPLRKNYRGLLFAWLKKHNAMTVTKQRRLMRLNDKFMFESRTDKAIFILKAHRRIVGYYVVLTVFSVAAIKGMETTVAK